MFELLPPSHSLQPQSRLVGHLPFHNQSTQQLCIFLAILFLQFYCTTVLFTSPPPPTPKVPPLSIHHCGDQSSLRSIVLPSTSSSCCRVRNFGNEPNVYLTPNSPVSRSLCVQWLSIHLPAPSSTDYPSTRVSAGSVAFFQFAIVWVRIAIWSDSFLDRGYCNTERCKYSVIALFFWSSTSEARERLACAFRFLPMVVPSRQNHFLCLRGGARPRGGTTDSNPRLFCLSAIITNFQSA